jgi:hypothetical protein
MPDISIHLDESRWVDRRFGFHYRKSLVSLMRFAWRNLIYVAYIYWKRYAPFNMPI